MKTQEQLLEQFNYFVDSHHGIYSAQIFVQSLEFSQIEGMSQEDWNILLAGPDHEDYTEVWSDLDNVVVTGLDGVRYMVYQNEGIFLYPEEIKDLVDWDNVFN